jgi:hypothetical protein
VESCVWLAADFCDGIRISMTPHIETNCRICLAPHPVLQAYALKAPWIVGINPTSEQESALYFCSQCESKFFSAKFSETEISTMYEGYRDDLYLKRRHKWEPWYTKSVNTAIGHSEPTLLARKQHLKSLLEQEIDTSRIKSPIRVLDFGGDEGQFIPELNSIEFRAVLEISKVSPKQNVVSLANWDEAKDFNPDFIMICHVLEHVDNPRELIQRAAEILPIGGLLYVEVPLDYPPSLNTSFSRSWYLGTLKFMRKIRPLWIASDFLGLVSKRFFKKQFPGTVVKQNEHINFFTENSVTSLCDEYGFAHVASSEYLATVAVPILKTVALGSLFQKISARHQK